MTALPGPDERPAEVHDEDKYGFEALYRARVRDEEAGFEQCRKRVLARISEAIAVLEARYGGPPPYYMEYENGEWVALDSLREWITGQKVTSEPKA